MGSEINQSTIDVLQSYVSAGNYTQFYTTLYQNGSTISGLYIPGPTGQGIFGNYSHAHVGGEIGSEEFEQERERISSTIANGLLNSIQGTNDGNGNYRILTDVEFLQREIELFTDPDEGLGYSTEAYPGHDLIDLVGLDVPGATEGISVLEALQAAINAAKEERELHVSRLGQDMMTIADAEAAGAVFDEASGYYILNGQVMDYHVGVFEYKGKFFDSQDLIKKDGILYVRTDLFSENGEFELVPVGLPSGEIIKSIYQLYQNSGGEMCFGPEVPIDMWPLDPAFALDPNDRYKQYDQDAVRAKIWEKPIEQIRSGDLVVSHDKNGNMVPGYVPRTMTNDAKILLNLFGTRVTPGHVYYRPDSQKADKYETLIDILRDDGMIEHRDGVRLRAATNAPIDGPLDGFVNAITRAHKADGSVVLKDVGRIRLGTRFIVAEGKSRKSYTVADLIKAGGGVVGEDELIRVGDSEPMPFHWEFGGTLPKPEDFVLACSGTTLEDIYKAAEWEGQGPRLSAPMTLDRGPVRPLKGAAFSAMPRNEPQDVIGTSVTYERPQRVMSRKQREALDAKLQKSKSKSAEVYL